MWVTVMDLLDGLLEVMGSIGYFFWRLLRSITVAPFRFFQRVIQGGGDLAWNIFWISMVSRMLFRLLLGIAASVALYKGYQMFGPTIGGALGTSNGSAVRSPRP